MRIIHILFTIGWGGLERYAIGQAKRIAARGHDVEFWRRKGAPVDIALIADGFPGKRLSPIKYIDLPTILKIRAAAKTADILHAHNSSDLGLVSPALCKLNRQKLIFSNYMQIPSSKRDIYHRLEYGRIDRMLLAADVMKKNAADQLPIPTDKIEVLPYGIDITNFHPNRVGSGLIREKYGIDSDSPIIGVISRLDPLKGQMEMIEAMPAIIEHEPKAILMLVGSETEEIDGWEKRLRSRAEELFIGDKVIFTGHADNTAEYLSDFTIYVLPSHTETFSLGCLEAMAMGLPIVGSDAAGTPEMLDYGACGLLAKPKETKGFAEKVITLLSSNNLRKELGAKAREKIEGVYELGIVTDRLEAIYRGEY